MLKIAMCLSRDESKKKEADQEVKPAMDETCVFEDLNEDKLKEGDEEDKMEVKAGEEDTGALGDKKEELEEVGKEAVVALPRPVLDDKTGGISEVEARKEDTEEKEKVAELKGKQEEKAEMNKKEWRSAALIFWKRW